MNIEFQSIHAVGMGIIDYLSQTFQFERQDPNLKTSVAACSFQLLSSAEINRDSYADTVSLFLYRTTINEHLRNHQRQADSAQTASLYVDLYYLCSFWFSSAEREQEMLAWIMHKMHRRQQLSNADMKAENGWNLGDQINIYPVDLSIDDLTRIWGMLMPKYRLSLAYVARSVRIAELKSPAGAAVTTRRLLVRQQGGKP